MYNFACDVGVAARACFVNVMMEATSQEQRRIAFQVTRTAVLAYKVVPSMAPEPRSSLPAERCQVKAVPQGDVLMVPPGRLELLHSR